MGQVNIDLFLVAKTQVDKEEVRRWLDRLGVSEDWQFPNEEIVSNPALNIAMAAKRCYMSYEAGLNPNVNKVRSDYVEYFDNILKSGHGSVLEHSVFSFAMEGVSRVFTAEMNRHRAGWAISEGSLRYIRFDKEIPWWLPTSLQVQEGDDDELKAKKVASQAIFEKAFKSQEESYKQLIDLWDMDASDKNFHYKKTVTSCLRRIVGLGVATGGVWTGNVRALRHVMTMRASAAAEEEILHVFSRIAKRMRDEEPLLFGDFEEDANGFWKPKYHKV
jgi:thymidylate synthase (FAD)